MHPEINVLALHHKANSERLHPEPGRPLLSPRPSLVPESPEGPKCSGDWTKWWHHQDFRQSESIRTKNKPEATSTLSVPPLHVQCAPRKACSLQ